MKQCVGIMTLAKERQCINLLNALYYSREASIPVAFEVVRKPT